MFDLERAIGDWRRQMLAAGIRVPALLDELENHLHEDIERQIRSGLAKEQAFDAAVQRIGPARTLEAEFAKTAELKEARERKLKLRSIVLAGLGYLLPLALSAPKPWSGMNGTEQWFGLAAVTLTVLAMFSGLYIHGFLPIILNKRIRTRVQFACAVPVLLWLCVFAYMLLPRLELTVGQTTVATLWAISPLAIFVGLIFGLDEAAHRTSSPVSS